MILTAEPSSRNVVFALREYTKSDSIPTPEQALAMYAATWDEWISLCVPGIDVEKFKEFYISIKQDLPCKYPAVQGALEAIAFTRELGPHGIMTSRSERLFYQRAQEAGIDLKIFDFCHTIEDVKNSKPHPDAFEPGIRIITEKGVVREEIAYVGDRETDYETACNAGIQFIGVMTRPRKDEIDKLNGLTVASVADVPAYIREQNSKGE